MTTGKLYERVAVKLSDASLLKCGKELAAKESEYKQVDDEKAEALNTFNAKLKTIEAEIADLADKVNNQREEVDIEIREEFDYGRKMVVKVRAENGHPISTRPMTIQEMGEGKMDELRQEQEDAADGEIAEAEDPLAPAAKPKGSRSRKAKAEPTEATEEVGAEE